MRWPLFQTGFNQETMGEGGGDEPIQMIGIAKKNYRKELQN